MKNNFDPRFKIIGASLVATVIVVVALAWFFKPAPNQPGVDSGSLQPSVTSYDFGDVPIRGGTVSYDFLLKNVGQTEVVISGISTSCMCTNAVLTVAGQRSPTFGLHNNPLFWSTEIGPEQTAELTVTFDPLAHGPDAIGPVTRVIKVVTKEPKTQTFTVTANVVR